MMPRGAVNAWECPCGALTVAVHVDDGVTPMFLACRYRGGCGLRAVSLGYPATLGSDIDQLAWEWYRPTERWARRQGPDVARHIEAGGLVLRELTDAGRTALAEAVTR